MIVHVFDKVALPTPVVRTCLLLAVRVNIRVHVLTFTRPVILDLKAVKQSWIFSTLYVDLANRKHVIEHEIVHLTRVLSDRDQLINTFVPLA